MNFHKYTTNINLVILTVLLVMQTPASTQAKRRRMKSGDHCGRQRHFWHRVNTCMVGFRDLLDEYHVQQKQEPSMIDVLVMALGLKKLCRGYEEMLLCLHVVLSKCNVANNKHMKKLQRQLMPLRGRMDAFCNPRRIEELQDNLFNRLKTRNSTQAKDIYAKVETNSGHTANGARKNKGLTRPDTTTMTTTTVIITTPSDHKPHLRQFVLNLPDKGATEENKNANHGGNTDQAQWSVIIANKNDTTFDTTTVPSDTNNTGKSNETGIYFYVNLNNTENNTHSNNISYSTSNDINTDNVKSLSEDHGSIDTTLVEAKTEQSSVDTATPKSSSKTKVNTVITHSEQSYNGAIGLSCSIINVSLYSVLIVTISLLQTSLPIL